MAPDISVILPTFRRPLQLAEALQSVLSQTGVELEVIVLDDSPEQSAEPVVARLSDERVTYFSRKEPSGGRPALVRNEGIARTRGRILHFLDDDDRVAANAYSAALEAFAAYPTRGVLFGRIEPFGKDPSAVSREAEFFRDGARRARIAMRTGSRHWMAANMLFSNTPLVNSACMIRRECAVDLGGYDPRLPVFEDVEFYIRAIRKFGYIFLDRLMLHYRYQHDSLMHSAEGVRQVRDSFRLIYENYRTLFGEADLLATKLLARSVLRFI